MKGGVRGYERDCVEPFLAARREVLGTKATGSPRILIRVDEFPHTTALDEPARFGPDAFRRFHAVMADVGVRYLIAALPRPSNRPHDPRRSGGREMNDVERELLRDLHGEGVEVAVHGLDHRTRDARPRHRSELIGLTPPQLESRLDAAESILGEVGVEPRVFVPPFNRFSRSQYPILAARYDVVCGGPETVVQMGCSAHAAVAWGSRLHARLPALVREIARSAARRRAVDRAGGRAVDAGGAPLGLGIEDDFEQLRELAKLMAPFATAWNELPRSPHA
jgi:peptidoglycan/xylan/chitin deacetylase (PgdA/CDA1 family)